MGRQVVFQYEAKERLRVAVLGTSGHTFRNYMPVLPFLPAEYVAHWDPDKEQARAFARMYGATGGPDAAYDDLGALLDAHKPDAVWIGTDALESDGRTIQPRLIAQCLEAGVHVFADKPVASTTGDVRDLIKRRDRAGKVVGVGIKTMHYPTHSRAREIVDDPAAGFGTLVSVSVRYPLHVPSKGGLPVSDRTVHSCVGHVWHPIGASLRVAGPLASIYTLTDPAGKGAVSVGTYRSGAVATFHFPRSKSGTSPLERFEAVGDGANIIIENAARLTYYRKASPGPYGRTADALTSLADGPLHWEPELTLGQLYNDHNFIQGYGQSLLHFLDAIAAGQPTTVGTLEDALEVLKVHEALCEGPGKVVEIPEG
jgi:predicted dehydrogenase